MNDNREPFVLQTLLPSRQIARLIVPHDVNRRDIKYLLAYVELWEAAAGNEDAPTVVRAQREPRYRFCPH